MGEIAQFRRSEIETVKCYPVVPIRQVPAGLWPLRYLRAAAMRVRRHDQRSDLFARPDRQPALLAGQGRDDQARQGGDESLTSFGPRPSPPIAPARNGGFRPSTSGSPRASSKAGSNSIPGTITSPNSSRPAGRARVHDGANPRPLWTLSRLGASASHEMRVGNVLRELGCERRRARRGEDGPPALRLLPSRAPTENEDEDSDVIAKSRIGLSLPSLPFRPAT